MNNSNLVCKFIIVKDLSFTEYMVDENDNIVIYDTIEEAGTTCGIYEFLDVLIMEIKCNYKDDL